MGYNYHKSHHGVAIMKAEQLKKDVTAKLNEELVWLDVREAPFDVYGLYDYKRDDFFRRLPDDVAAATSKDVAGLYKNTAGGRVRFSTDSDIIAIKAVYNDDTWVMPNMPLSGSAGFDMYRDLPTGSVYDGSFIPDKHVGENHGYEAQLTEDGKMCSYTICFPLYHNVIALYVGLKPNAEIRGGKKYKYDKPVLFYGSSITQGASASKPGNSYEAMASRAVDFDYINLGFSGACKAEPAIRDYICAQDMSIFVYDYDHNSPTPQYLVDTHAEFFKAFRSSHPMTPVIFMTRPDFDGRNEHDNTLRRNTVYTTFIEAFKGGDENVYFIDGERMYEGDMRDACSGDGTHPNDLGMYRMANTLIPVFRKIFAKLYDEQI